MSGEADDGMGDDVYQPDGSEVGTDQGILDAEDTLDDRGVDPYDEGWSPPERPWEVERFGTTAAEQRDGESLDQRLAEEVPDPALEAPDEWADTLGDASDTDGELLDGEVGNRRAGRLVGQDKGDHELFAEDVGIDGAAASAEEAAVHLVAEEDEGHV